MATKAAQRSAAKLLRLHKGLPPSTNAPARAAARRILDGRDRPDDADLVFRTLGIGRSGRKFKRQARQAIDPIRNIAQSAVVAANEARTTDEGRSGVATAVLIATATREFERILNTKYVKRAVEEVGKRIGGTRIGQALGINQVSTTAGLNTALRFLRLGGMAATAGIVGQEAVLKLAQIYKDQARGRMEIVQAQQRAFEAGITPSKIQEISKFSEIDAYLANRGLGGAWNLFLEDIGVGKSGEQIRLEKEAQQREYNQRIRARKLVEEFGVSRQRVLANAARAKGKTIAELTDRERNRAIDAAIEEFANPRKVAQRPEVRRRIEAQLDEELRPTKSEEGFLGNFAYFMEHVQIAARDAVAESTGLIETTAELRELRRIELERDELEAFLSRREKEIQARYIATQRNEEQLTVAQRMQRQEVTELATASFNNRRSRHKGWNND